MAKHRSENLDAESAAAEISALLADGTFASPAEAVKANPLLSAGLEAFEQDASPGDSAAVKSGGSGPAMLRLPGQR